RAYSAWARGHPRRNRAHARGTRDALAARQPDAVVAPGHGGRPGQRGERARRRRALAPDGVAHRRLPRVPAIARSSKPVRPRARRQPGGEHRGHAPHRLGHAPGTDPLPRLAEENMDKVRLALAAIVLLGGCGKRETASGTGAYDLVLKNGWIVDGSGNPRYRGDVA